MSSQIVPIHRTAGNSTNANDKNDGWFNAFDFTPGHDANIRWLSRPNQQLVQGRHSDDAEKFRITFDVENFQPEQIKIYTQNRKLTISGVYEEHSEGRSMQKQFERSFDIPKNADVESMASFITSNHMLVVEIPLYHAGHVDHLSLGNNANDQRRQSFSLSKFNTANDQGLLSSSNDSSTLSTPGQQMRRTSVTKTTTTTTTTGSSALPAEAAALLKGVDSSLGNSTQASSTHTTERRSSNAGNQQLTNNESNTSSTSSKKTTLTSSNLENLPVEIPAELLATGGTITIQKRKVSVSKGSDANSDHTTATPLTSSNNASSSSTTTATTTSSAHNNDQGVSVPIARNNNNTESSSSTTTTKTATSSSDQGTSVPIARNTNTSSSSNTLNQQQSNTSERRGSKTLSSTNQSRMYTFEEFLQNKTWNPSVADGSDGKKILHMRLQMKPGTKLDQMKITLAGYNLRVEVDNKVSSEGGRAMNEHSYRQVTLFPNCEVEHLKTELKDDGYLHIQVPINL